MKGFTMFSDESLGIGHAKHLVVLPVLPLTISATLVGVVATISLRHYIPYSTENVLFGKIYINISNDPTDSFRCSKASNSCWPKFKYDVDFAHRVAHVLLGNDISQLRHMLEVSWPQFGKIADYCILHAEICNQQ
mmetsp:Transcript_35086/g.73075  ORF Transcript_35086/g.73075 Transcript_35086/m.73075 type:complete len:135 (-) Transcript_35086:100-504(-)